MEHCPYCVRAKQLLTEKKIPFEEFRVTEEDDAEWDRLFQLSGMRTMPQIFKGDQLIGGYTELAELNKKDGLQSLK